MSFFPRHAPVLYSILGTDMITGQTRSTICSPNRFPSYHYNIVHRTSFFTTFASYTSICGMKLPRRYPPFCEKRINYLRFYKRETTFMALKHLFSFFQHTAYFCQFWNRISQFPFFNLFRGSCFLLLEVLQRKN